MHIDGLNCFFRAYSKVGINYFFLNEKFIWKFGAFFLKGILRFTICKMGIENSYFSDVQVLKNYVSVKWVFEKYLLLDNRLLINSVSVKWVFNNMKFRKESIKNFSCLIFEIIAFSRYWKILPKWYGCNMASLGIVLPEL